MIRPGDDQAEQRAIEQDAAVVGSRPPIALPCRQRIADRPPDRRDRRDRGDQEALVHRAHDVLAAAEADEIGAEDRGDDAHAADQQRQRHHRHQVVGSLEQQRGQHHRGADGDDVGLEQVGGHAGAVADVVADVVGDHGRVARVVLGNAGLDLADEVGADVGGLGEDAAAETGEDRDQRGAEGQRGQRLDHGAVLAADGVAAGPMQVPVEHRDREQREAGDQHAGDGAGAEGQGQALLQADFCGRAVRTLERTEMFMPMKPATPESTAPSTKPAAESGRGKPRRSRPRPRRRRRSWCTGA
jgi:hypothetical protein